MGIAFAFAFLRDADDCSYEDTRDRYGVHNPEGKYKYHVCSELCLCFS